MKKILYFTIVFSVFLSASITGQINFKNVIMQVPNTTTTMGAVQIGDINNDGLNDVVCGSVYYNNIYYELYIIVYTQKKDGTFAEPVKMNYTRMDGPITNIEIADVNNDRLNDIVFSFGTKIGIYYQLSGGGFSDLRTLTGIDASNGIKVGDLNNDGLNDILGFVDSKYKIFYQNQSGDFDLTTISAPQTNYAQLQIGDLNGDNLNDIANIYNSKIEILYQKKGVGIATTDSLIISPMNKDSYETAFEGFTIGDVNNDGRKDVIATYGGNDGRMKIFYQTSDGKIDTTNAKSYKAYDIPTAVKIADLNCDGDNEIIIGNDAWEKISIYNKRNMGDYGSYTLYPSLYYFTPYSMAVGDINNDGRPDIIDVDQEAKMSILYNISKPLTFDSYEYKVINLQVKRDTTALDTVVYSAIADTVKTCKRNNYLKQQIHQILNNEHYSGDSLLIRHGMLCSVYIDTIKTTFVYTKNLIIKSDTIKSVENRDALNYVSFGNTIFSSESNSTYGYINANICWNISVDSDWVKPDIYSGGSGVNGKNIDTYVGFTISANQTTKARQAIITFSGDRVPSIYITINQKGFIPAIYTSTSSIVLSDDVNNSAYLLLAANISWKISSDADWLTLDKTQGVATVNDYEIITIQATPNMTDSDKNAVITITGAEDDVIKTVSVKQLKKDLNAVEAVNNTRIRIYPNPIQDKLMIETNSAIRNLQIQGYDLRGLSVFGTNLTKAKSEIDFSNLPKGVYFLKINNNGEISIKKIIKQ